ncbi:MAG: glycerophosphodiester phosphodiesterase [Proteobacteria bacterium]|nr:glycerophosphodiester phosphodiesterase [Pseudomonadota bacterium]
MRTFQCLALVAFLTQAGMSLASESVIIAHRNASGYLPEHTLAGLSVAHSMGSDFVEPDVVLTKDNVPIVMHDIYLDETTDVAIKFPRKKRPDGRWYAIDFKLKEIQSLTSMERFDRTTGDVRYKGRFPKEVGLFKVPTLDEYIVLVKALNKSFNANVGIYLELKDPAFHKNAKKDISLSVLNVLSRYGYATRDSGVVIQCFDAETLKELRAVHKTELPLVQLIGDDDPTGRNNYSVMKTEEGLAEIAKYANGVAPNISHILKKDQASPIGVSATKLVEWAHRNQLFVHVYTVRSDDLPPGVPSEEFLLKLLIQMAKVDGVFTDFPDRTKAIVKNL